MSSVPKIVLAGGPGAGKSSALEFLEKELKQFGYTVIPVYEAATSVMQENTADRDRKLEFQLEVARRQLRDEAEAEKLASGDKCVIICDRGMMDCRVYLDDEDYGKFKEEIGMSEVELRDRYDAAFHFDSTSVDDGGFYITDENRIENREDAAILNKKSLNAWCGNPHYRFIPCYNDVNEKLAHILREVKAFLGIPAPLEIERKFLIKLPDVERLLMENCVPVEIEQHYLIGDYGRFRIRKRGSGGSYIYIKTVKEKISDTVRYEKETRLTEEEYNSILENNISTGNIRKTRYCLMYNGRYYEIDIFPFWKKQAFLEVELLSEGERFVMPEFIELLREVTHDRTYKNSALCRNIPREDI